MIEIRATEPGASTRVEETRQAERRAANRRISPFRMSTGPAATATGRKEAMPGSLIVLRLTPAGGIAPVFGSATRALVDGVSQIAAMPVPTARSVEAREPAGGSAGTASRPTGSTEGADADEDDRDSHHGIAPIETARTDPDAPIQPAPVVGADPSQVTTSGAADSGEETRPTYSFDELVERLVRFAALGADEAGSPFVTLELDLADLGSVRVHVAANGPNRICVRFVLMRDALAEFRGHADRLRDRLVARGIEVDSVDLGVRGDVV